MSMMGRFVQVSPDLLKEIIGDPSDVEELFISEQAAKAMPQLAGALGALQGRPTKLLAASMASLNHVATSGSVLRARELGC